MSERLDFTRIESELMRVIIKRSEDAELAAELAAVIEIVREEREVADRIKAELSAIIPKL